MGGEFNLDKTSELEAYMRQANDKAGADNTVG